MKYLTLIMCVWMLVSCEESREEAMLRLVNEWNGKEIKLPVHSVFTIQGKDTVDFEFGNANYNVFNAQKSETLSDIALANVEALAGEEWDGDNHCFMDTTFWVCLKYTTGVGCYCGL